MHHTVINDRNLLSGALRRRKAAKRLPRRRKEGQMKKLAFLFTGQSSQYVGMGKSLYEERAVCRALYDQADAVMGRSVSALCFDGPREELDLTENTQPCILTTEYAAYAALAERGVQPDAMAGFSLGEYGALAAAGVLTFEEALGVIKVRAKAMQEAVPAGRGAMVAVLGPAARAEELSREVDGYLAVSNRNAPTRLIFAGEISATRAFQALLDAEGIKNQVIPVSIPSHCALMQPAQAALDEAFSALRLHAPRVDFYMNTDGEKETDPRRIQEKMVRQLCVAVQCEQIVRNLLRDGVDTFVELGPKTMYSAFVREIAPQATLLHVEDQASLEETAAALGA